MNINLINRISGGNHPEGVKLLYELAQESPTDRILELGSFVGKSAIVMASALKDAGRKGTILCIDRFANNIKWWGPGHPSYPEALKSFWEHADYIGVSDYLVAIQSEITTAISRMQGKFGMIYIDGGHTLENVIPNALWAWENLVEGGILLFDDYDHAGTHTWKDVKTCVDCLLVKWQRPIYKQAALMAAIKK